MYTYLHKSSNLLVAVKKMKTLDFNEYEEFKRELKTMLLISSLSKEDCVILNEYFAFSKMEGPRKFYHAYAVMEKGDQCLSDLVSDCK